MQQQRRPLVGRVAWAAGVGTAIESYDFFIYSMAAALVFPAVFFPELESTAATVAAMGTFAAAFVSRPFGAVLFGYFGDRFGRTTTLAATLLLMGAATVAVGLVPSASSIGGAAPILVILLRLAQGVAAGGEWSGSAVLTAEYADPDRRGALGMATPVGAGAGVVLANLVFLVVNISVGEKSPAFLSWGWRIPFLVSAVLVVIALYLRLRIAETPVFADTEVVEHERLPLVTVVGGQWRGVLLGTGVTLSMFAFFFLMLTYLAGYAVGHLGHPRWLTLLTGMLGGMVEIPVTAIAALAADRFGRRRVMLAGYALALPWALVLLPIIDTGSRVVYVLAIMLTFALASISSGPLPALLAEIFPTRARYTGIGLAYNLGGILGGALPPVLAGPLVASFGSGSLGVLIAGMTVVSATGVWLLAETRGSSLSTLDDRAVRRTQTRDRAGAVQGEPPPVGR